MVGKKSPLKFKPHRVPGQSLSEYLDDFATDQLLLPILASSMCILVATMEWIHHLKGTPPMPWTMTTIAVVVLAASVWRLFHVRKQIQALKLGRDGERAVGQYLERFREMGFQIYHDLGTGDSNIDHVLIGAAGIYTIETKTLSKPERGACKITVDENGVLANGHRLDRNPIIQAKAQAAWLRQYFGDAGFRVPVQPVVVFPGWFVEQSKSTDSGVLVIEPKMLPRVFETSTVHISDVEVRAVTLCLSNYIRSQSTI